MIKMFKFCYVKQRRKEMIDHVLLGRCENPTHQSRYHNRTEKKLMHSDLCGFTNLPLYLIVPF